ncbi:ATP-binding protein [Chitinophagales bacterium]|nr:ATP-binding protein [Chitinophagales bacterium]
MSDKNEQENYLQSIYLQYELALSIGRSFDVQENISQFLNTFHRRAGLNFSGVFLAGDNGEIYLEKSIPGVSENQINTTQEVLTSFDLTYQGMVVLNNTDDRYPLFDSITDGKYGSIALLPLAGLGFLLIYRKGDPYINKAEYARWEAVLQSFSYSIQGTLAFRKANEEKAKTRGVINSALDAVIMINSRGLVTSWNKQAFIIFGWTEEEVLNNPLHHYIIPPSLRDAHTNGMKHLQKTGEGPVLNKRIEVPAVTKDGKDLLVELTVMPIQLEREMIFGAYVRDITADKAAQRALEEARETAETAVAARERFLANMSHEVRTPLNAIVGMTELLKGTALSVEQLSYLNGIETSSANLLVTVNDILDISKLQAGKIQLEARHFSLEQLMQSLELTEGQKARSKGLQFEVNFKNKLAEAYVGDPIRLLQILLNIVSNAIKFTNKGFVRIDISVYKDQVKAQSLFFSVVDSGIGISPEKIETIFESFSQEDESISRRFGGTGLGLSIAKNLLSAFGSDLSVASEKDKGSNFFFELLLPIGDINKVEKHRERDVDVEQFKGMKLILAEDQELNRFFMKKILTDLGLIVFEAINGQEVIDLMESKETFDFILMDMQMPIMDGLEATEKIRKELKNSIPIMALTANVTAAHKKKCFESGMNSFISKPFEMNRFLRKLKQLLALDIGSTVEDDVEMQEEKKAIDLSSLHQAARGDDEFVRSMIKLFIDRTPPTVEAIVLHHKNKQHNQMKELAHQLKASVAFMKMDGLLSSLKRIEKEADTLDEDSLSALVAEMKEQSDSNIKLLTEALASL